MKKQTCSALLATLLASCAVDDTQTLAEETSAYTTLPPIEQSTASIVADEVGDAVVGGQRRYVGVSVAVIRDGVRTWHHFGEAVRGTGVAPNSNTLYAIGSITKTMTATMLARMEKENTVEYGDYLTDLEPTLSLPAERKWITLEQLATYHSGLPGNPYSGGEDTFREGSYTDDMAALMDSLEVCSSSNPCKYPLNPWDDHEYSNYGYAVLGNLLARQGGYGSVQNALYWQIFNPLGMTRTSNKASLTDAATCGACPYSSYGMCTYSTSCNSTFSPNAAVGYHINSAGSWVREGSPGSNDNVKAGSGVLWSTPNDMMKWLAFNMGMTTNIPWQLLTAKDQALVVRAFDNIGLGWQQVEYSYGDVWKKSGALPAEDGFTGSSFNAYIAFVEGSDDGVVVMTNGPFGSGTVALDILERIAD